MNKNKKMRRMSYTITLSENGKYLICHVSGEITSDVALAFTAELDQQSRALGIKRFLTDVRGATNALSTFESYDYAYRKMAEMELQRDVRAAVLARPEDQTHDFVEVVVRNAGYNVRFFRDESEAVAWLSE